MKPRAVLDASVLIGKQRGTLVLLAERGWFVPLWSPFIIAETVRVRTQLAMQSGEDMLTYRTHLNQFIGKMSASARNINYTNLQGNWTWLIRDPDDEPVLATALVGKAHYVVSNDKKHFPPTGFNPYPSVLNPLFRPVTYVTAQQFIAEVVRLRGHHSVASALMLAGLPAPPQP